MDTDHEFVARDILEDAGGYVAELDTNFGLLLVEGCDVLADVIDVGWFAHTLAGLQDERNAVPSLVLDVCNHGAECRATRILRDCVVFLVCWLATV